MQDENIIVIDINLTRGLVVLLALALLMAAFVGYLAWGQREAVASSPQAPVAASSSMRQYYVTKDVYDGSEALTACASGYHMASLWEIMDPSNLKYNTDLGRTRDDSGQGPPSSGGWVRTGSSSNNSSGIIGQDNCNAWTTTAGGGTHAYLRSNWTAGQDIHVWSVGSEGCVVEDRVLCVED